MKRYTPDAPAIWCLLGKLVQNRGDVKRAVDHYVDALRLNPFMWDAFERICETGNHSSIKIPMILLIVIQAPLSVLHPFSRAAWNCWNLSLCPKYIILYTNQGELRYRHKYTTVYQCKIHQWVKFSSQQKIRGTWGAL